VIVMGAGSIGGVPALLVEACQSWRQGMAA
jgi:hypothetical protein